MTNEINGFRPRTLDTNTNKSADRAEQSAGRKTPASTPAAASPGTDSVRLTDSAARLKELETLLAQVPEVDASRVDALRQAIAEGKYNVDNVHVAEKLIAFERNLFGKE